MKIQLGSTMWAVGGVATLLFLATGVQGFRLGGEDPAVEMHLLMALGSAMLLLLAHGWILLYTLATGRVIRRTMREEGVGDELGREILRVERRTWPWALVVAVAAVVALASGAALFAGYLPPAAHAWIVGGALGLQGLALAWELQGVRRHEALIQDLSRRLRGEAGPTP